jgi:formate hydrogenlyase subunit 6/NADH:ubiquinone oxidoreductase subunit I
MKLKVGAMLPEVFRHLFRRPATIECPFVDVPTAKAYRGKPVMDPLKCIGCNRCVMDCPAEALEIRKEYEYKNEQGKPVRRFSMTLYIDRCTHCSQCEESCPVDAIRMDSDHGNAAFTRAELIVRYQPEPPPPGATLAAATPKPA